MLGKKMASEVKLSLDYNSNFNLIIRALSNVGEIELDLESFITSKQKFSKNIANLLKIFIQERKNHIDFLPSPLSAPDNCNIEIWVGDIKIAIIQKTGNQINLLQEFEDKLCVFETRIIGRAKSDFTPQAMRKTPHPLTDLHTHLSGQISSQDLIDIGLEANILYPTAIFDNLQLDYNKNNIKQIPKRIFLPTAHLQNNQSTTENAIPMRDLSPSLLDYLKNLMCLQTEYQSSFEDIEKAYSLRETFTKNNSLLAQIINKVAREYSSWGVKYVELSTNSLIDPEWLSIAEKAIKESEAETGLTIRMLAGIPRNLTDDQIKSRMQKIVALCEHPLIVGLDILGYEINKTIKLDKKLEILAKSIKPYRPDFIYRIHAGENTKNPTNVKDAMLFALENNVMIRIGHAIHGVDDETLEMGHQLSKNNMLIVEFNPDSNLATNNIDFGTDIPVQKFYNNEVKFVFGSDGSGMYQTSIKQLTKTMQLSGVTDKQFKYIRNTEEEYIEFRKSKHKTDYQINPRQIISQEDIEQEKTNYMNNEYNKARIMGKIPLFIAGAAGSSWQDIDKKHQEIIRQALEFMVESLDDSKIYFLSGRSKDKGITVELGKILTLNKFKTGENFLHVSMVAETPNNNEPAKPKGISIIKDFDSPLVYLPSGTINFLKKHNGIAIFIGGKSFTRDFIIEAAEQGVKFGLMKDINGASHDKSLIYKDNSFACSTESLVSYLRKISPDILKS